MRLLLDTHIWLWGLLEPERLVPEVAAALEAPGVGLWLSPVSVWEALVLAEKGRIDVGPDAVRWVDEELRAAPMRDVPLTRQVARLSRTVLLPHEDPADRFLVATAVVHELTLVTADERLLAAGACALLANR